MKNLYLTIKISYYYYFLAHMLLFASIFTTKPLGVFTEGRPWRMEVCGKLQWGQSPRSSRTLMKVEYLCIHASKEQLMEISDEIKLKVTNWFKIFLKLYIYTV